MTKILATLLLIVPLAAIGCAGADNIVFQHPRTGQIVDCSAQGSAGSPTAGGQIYETMACVNTYQKMGWTRVNSPMRAFVPPLAAVLLAGCVSSIPLAGPGTGTDATFTHPATGVVRHCENPGAAAAFRGGILAANAYADCKTSAEEQGYVRRRGDQ